MMTDAKSNKTKLVPKKQYVAIMYWSSVGNFPLLESASGPYMSGYHNQEMLFRDVIVPQRTVRRAWRNQNIL